MRLLVKGNNILVSRRVDGVRGNMTIMSPDPHLLARLPTHSVVQGAFVIFSSFPAARALVSGRL